MGSAQESELAPFLGDLSLIEKLSEIFTIRQSNLFYSVFSVEIAWIHNRGKTAFFGTFLMIHVHQCILVSNRQRRTQKS